MCYRNVHMFVHMRAYHFLSATDARRERALALVMSPKHARGVVLHAA